MTVDLSPAARSAAAPAMGLERSLTTSECALLPPLLAAAIDLDAVRIVRRFHTPFAKWFNLTIARGARVFWANAPVEAMTLFERSHLAHELVHVWQYKALRRTGIELLASRIYRYRLDPARPFLSYGYEQQASIVEDYTRMRGGGCPRRAVGPAQPIAAFERVIASAPMLAPGI